MTPYYSDGDVTLHHGHALDVARTLPSGLARTIVTSPPYFGLRDYGHDDQLGAEATVDAYVSNLVTLFRELRRVLADDGTLWLNLGDTYSFGTTPRHNTNTPNRNRDGSRDTTPPLPLRADGTGLSAKNLAGVPWRVAFALQADGWILRSDIIWAKPNPMPESVTDRPTKAHEYLFLLAKQPRYYYDADAIAEPVAPGNLEHYERHGSTPRASKRTATYRNDTDTNTHAGFVPNGGQRNKRSVWEVQPSRFVGAHFAVFPSELVRPCILAGSTAGDTVLDPFSGSGTTGMVATFEGRRYIGIDVNAGYLDLSLRTRFAQPALDFGIG